MKSAPTEDGVDDDEEGREVKTLANLARAAEGTLRVEAGRINTVMNLVGELIIGKSMLQRAIRDWNVVTKRILCEESWRTPLRDGGRDLRPKSALRIVLRHPLAVDQGEGLLEISRNRLRAFRNYG